MFPLLQFMFIFNLNKLIAYTSSFKNEVLIPELYHSETR